MKILRGLIHFVVLAVRTLFLLGGVSRGSSARPRSATDAPTALAPIGESANAGMEATEEPIPIMPEAVWVNGRRIHLPPPSIWPAVLAFGAMMLMFGLITSVVFDAVGLLLIAWAIIGWISEISHEQEE